MKVALITGGTKGIGLGIAEKLLANGYKIAITGRTQAGIDATIASLKENYQVRIIGIVADVQDPKSMLAMKDQTLAAFGRIDILVANAGIGKFANIKDLSIEDWNLTINTNLNGVFYSVKATLDEIIKQEGYIITMASLAGCNFFENGTAYNASKFGLVGFSQALMLDVRNLNVKVTTIMPGSVATYFNDHIPNDQDDWKIQPEDIGQMVLDLLHMNPRTLPSKIEVRPTRVKKQ